MSLMIESSYAFWQHRSGGEIYAVKTDENGTVCGLCGPLRREECRFEALPNYDYDAENAAWAEREAEQFRLVEPRDLEA